MAAGLMVGRSPITSPNRPRASLADGHSNLLSQNVSRGAESLDVNTPERWFDESTAFRRNLSLWKFSECLPFAATSQTNSGDDGAGLVGNHDADGEAPKGGRHARAGSGKQSHNDHQCDSSDPTTHMVQPKHSPHPIRCLGMRQYPGWGD
jgi:hypothetical protein